MDKINGFCEVDITLQLQIIAIFMAGADTPEGERLDMLVTLVEAHEAKQFPLDLPDPVKATKFETE